MWGWWIIGYVALVFWLREVCRVYIAVEDDVVIIVVGRVALRSFVVIVIIITSIDVIVVMNNEYKKYRSDYIS